MSSATTYEMPALAYDPVVVEDRSHRWVVAFIVIQILCQLALLIPALGPSRIVFRSAAYGTSLALLILLRRRVPGTHPATFLVGACIALMLVGYANPNTQPLAGLAQIGLSLAIVGPILWIPRLQITARTFRHIALTYWGFQTLSSIFGVLQVRYPGRFLPELSVNFAGKDVEGALTITLASGEQIMRPMGLTDAPGGAANAGYYTVLFGLGLLLTDRSKWVRTLAFASIPIGLFCIYMSMVRVMLVLTVIAIIVLLFGLFRQRQMAKFNFVLTSMFVVGLATLSAAFTIGGDTVRDRVMSLVEASPGEVYQSNRGQFLIHTFTEVIPEFPFGAGAGRWGMMNNYFGNRGIGDNSLWAEIQWTAWVYDGGLLLMIASVIAITLTCWYAWTIARNRANGALAIWAALVVAYNLGVVAILFSYPVFASPLGMDFWMLNGVLFAAHRYQLWNSQAYALESEARS